MANAMVLTSLGAGIVANRIKGAGTEPLYVGFGTGGGTRTATAADTALTTPSGARSTGTSSVVTTTNTNDTYKVVATFVAGATITINEIMSFDAATGGNSFISSTITGIALNSGDAITASISLKAA